MELERCLVLHRKMITILTVGETKDKNIRAQIQEYLKRLSSQKIILKTVKEEKGNNLEIIKKKEGERLVERIKDNEFVIVLSEEGKLMNSFSFADFLKKKQMEKNIVFVLGAAFGLDSAVKKKANFVLSISPMTFPHEIALLLLVEQIYRAHMITSGRNYQK